MRADSPVRRLASGATTGGLPTKQLGILLAALLVSVTAGYFGYQRYLAASETTTTLQTTTARVGSLVSTVTATGNVISTKQSKLGFSASSTASGKITEIDAKVGDTVKAGQTLAKLDTQVLQSQLDQADSNLQTAQINLQKLNNGSTPQDIAAAQAAVDSAQANYQQVAAGVTGATLQADQSAVAQAQANVASAQAKLDAANRPYTDADIAAAKTAVDQAQAGLVSAQAKLDAIKNPFTAADWASALAAVDSTRANLKSAQASLDQTRKGPLPADLAAQQAAVDQAYTNLLAAQDRLEQWKNGDTGTGGTSNSEIEQTVQSAQTSYNAAVTKLKQIAAGPLPADLQSALSAADSAQANYNSAVAKVDNMKKGPLATDIQQAQSALDQARATQISAQAKYNLIQAGPVATDLTQAQAALDQANASLATSQAKLDDDNAGPKAADVAAARNTLAQAQANLTTKAGPPLATDVALAQQSVKQAQASYDQAKLNLANAVLTAPFDGMIAAVNANVGEQIGSSALFTLVDTSQIRIDGTVGETDVVKVQVGQAAALTFDALPGTTLNGKVIAISPSGTTTQGVVSYLVSVSVDNPGRTLPAGLSTTMSIVTDRKDNVLLVPLRTVRTQGQNHTVQVLPAGKDAKPETRQVQIGSQNDTQVEIVSGLSAGEQVVIPTTSTAQSRVNVPGVGGGFVGPGGR